MESSTLGEAMQNAVESVEESALTKETEISHSSLLPPINTEATVSWTFLLLLYSL